MNLNEAEAEVLHLRDALLRSEAELETEREMRRLTEEDNAIERQLRYEVEGDIDHLVVRAAERGWQSEQKLKAKYDAMYAAMQSTIEKGYRHGNRRLRAKHEAMKAKYEAMEAKYTAMRSRMEEERCSKQQWGLIASVLTNGSEDLAWELCDESELHHRVPVRRRRRIAGWIREAHRDMMRDRQRSREGTPPR
jgi:hypothetical protein